ncbi:SOS response-associated peptidase family protein [Cryobacterium breve]|uniref:SOS response-associated peptidase family protein n=1 Tax=Cryobacterium breve TaxID=1259258 RepID=UPI0032B30CE1
MGCPWPSPVSTRGGATPPSRKTTRRAGCSAPRSSPRRRAAVSGGLHERMPVVLPEETWDQWLDPHTVGDQEFVDAAVGASAESVEGLTFYEVAPLTGDGPELIEPVA